MANVIEAVRDMASGGDWYFWDELPWSSGLRWDDRWRFVECRNRSWLSCMELSPPDMEVADDAARLRHALRFHGALRTLGGGHAVWIDEHHEEEKPYLKAEPANRAARRHEEARARTYARKIGHFRSRHYLSVQWRRPPAWTDMLWRMLLTAHPGDRAGDYGAAFEAFAERVRALESSLAFLGARVLEGDGLAAYLHDTVSRVRFAPRFGNWQDWISPQLVDQPINVDEREDNGALTIGAGDEKEYVVPVTVHSYPHGCDAGLLDGTEEIPGLAALPITYRRVTRVAVQAKSESVRDMNSLRRKVDATYQNPIRSALRRFYPEAEVPTNHEAEAAAEEVEEWLRDLARNRTLRCQNTTTVLVYHPDPAVAVEQARTVCSHLRETAGLTAQVGRLGALEHMLGTIPGNDSHDYVRPYTNTLASAALAPLSRTYGGRRRDVGLGGPALMVGTANGCIRHHVVLSPQSAGMASHAILTGPSGSGKSAALNLMGFGFLKYPGARVFRVDKGRSAYAATLCAGGTIIDPALTGEGFQPLRFIDDWKERVWAARWLIAYVRKRDPALANDPERCDGPLKRTLDTLGRALAAGSLGRDDMTTNAFVQALPDPALRAALSPLTRDGTLGYVFDSVDRRSYGADWITVELDELAEDEEVAGPLMAYLWHLVRRLSSRDRPMLFEVDEAWAAMQGEFGAMVNKGMRTFRRENVRVVFASQSGVDIASSDLAHVIINACSLKVVFPDDAIGQEKVAAAYLALGVEPQWLERLNYRFDRNRRDGDPPEPRFALVMQDGGSSFMTLDAEPSVDQETYWMCCATDSGAVADALRVRDAPGEFLDNWLAEKIDGVRAVPARFLEAAE